MKKLLIIAAVAMAAFASHASAFSWAISSMNKVYVADSTSLLGSASAYLFDANAYGQAMLLDGLAGDGIDFTKAIQTATIAAGTITKTNFDYGADGNTTPYYMAIVDGDNVFVSAIVNGKGVEGKTTTVTLSGSGSKNAVAEWEKGSSFAAAGWYTAVPEPTSGLLLLLGMAGLALKRKQA